MAIANSTKPLSNRGAYAQMVELKPKVAKKVQDNSFNLFWKNIVDFCIIEIFAHIHNAAQFIAFIKI